MLMCSELTKMKECVSNTKCESVERSSQLEIVHTNMNRFDVASTCKQTSIDGRCSVFSHFN